jgi:hypothetical protein
MGKVVGVVTAVVAVAALAGSASASVIMHEQFSYADEAAFDAAYSNGGGDTEFNPTGMTSPNLNGEAGGSARIYSERPGRSIGATFGDENETVFVSFLMQSDTNAGSGRADEGIYRSLELYDGGNTSNGSGREYMIGLLRATGDSNKDSSDFEHRDYNQSGTGRSAILGDFNSDVNLFVTKFTFTNGGTDFTADAWLNPTAATDFNAASNRISGTGLEFDAFAMASFAEPSKSYANFDEIMFATSATDIVLVPEPGSLGLIVFAFVATGLLGRFVGRAKC